MMPPATRAYGYLRVSSADQIDGFSLETQERIIRDHCARMGWGLERLYVEAGKSAFTEHVQKRPQFRQMLEDAEAGGCEIVVCYQYDRFARWGSVALDALDRLKRARVRLTSVTEPFDPATAFGKLQYTQMAGWAEYYSSALSERLIRVNEVRKAKGQKVGALHYGARRDASGKEEVNPATAQHLRRVLELAATMTGEAAGQVLNAENAPTRKGNPWHASSVRKVVLAGAWLAAQPEPWPTLWAAAMAKRPAPSVRADRQTRTLTGLMRCGVCGLHVHYGPRDGAKIWLQCRSSGAGLRGCQRTTTERRTHAGHYEDAVAGWVADLPDVGVLRSAAQRLAASDDPARAALAEIDAARARLKFQHDHLIIDDATLAAEAAILNERARAIAPTLARDEKFAGEVARAAQVYPSMDTPSGRNAVLRQLIDHIVITGRALTIVPVADLDLLLSVAKERRAAA
jgi:DNA invertase Pin-like site-specific DNA recombinase